MLSVYWKSFSPQVGVVTSTLSQSLFQSNFPDSGTDEISGAVCGIFVFGITSLYWVDENQRLNSLLLPGLLPPDKPGAPVITLFWL